MLFTGHSTWPGRVKNAKLGFRGHGSGVEHEKPIARAARWWAGMRGDCEIGERSRGKLAVWKGCNAVLLCANTGRVEAQWLGKQQGRNKIRGQKWNLHGRAAARPPRPLALSFYFFPVWRERELRQLRLFPFVRNFVRVFRPDSDGKKNRRKETTWKRKGILFARDIFCERENSVSSFSSLRGYISLPERSSSAKIISQIGEGNPPFDFFLAQFRSFRNAF